MVKINLLPPHLRVQNKDSNTNTICAAIGGIAIGIIAILFAANLIQVNNLKNQKGAIETELTILKSAVAKIEQAKTIELSVSKKLEVVKTANKQKEQWSHVLARLAAASPSGVWFNNFAISEKDGGLVVRGNAKNHQLVSDFMQALQTDGYFKTIELRSDQMPKSDKSDKGKSLTSVEFEIVLSTEIVKIGDTKDKKAGGDKK